MADPFLGEIRTFSFNIVPQGWASCDGQLLQITQNNALYSLLGIRYGGDGKTNFNLPDFRGRAPIHYTTGYTIGSRAGSETVTLTTTQIPAHTHGLQATSNTTTVNTPGGNALASSPTSYPIYIDSANLVQMNANALANEGGGAGHNNMQPVLVLNFCIATTGIYPPRS